MSRSQSLGDIDHHHSTEIRPSDRHHRVSLSENRANHFFSSMNMDNPSNNNNAAVGETGTFRDRAMARHYVNTSRRNLLKQAQALSTKSFASTSSGVGESAPLMQASIPEDRSASNLNAMDVSDAGNKGQTDVSGEPPNLWKNFLEIWIGKYVSIFLLVTPLAIYVTNAHWSGAWVFWTNFFVLLPLASILGDFTEEAALHTNETIGGLLNATFGNCVEVIVALQALLRDEIRVVQASMIGSIFSNLLLVLGCCFFFGGIYYREQSFNVTSASASMGLLALSSLALVLPTPYANYYEVQDEDVLMISRAAALGLLVMYIQLLVFQLHTHRDVFDGPAEDSAEAPAEEGEADDEEEPSIPLWMSLFGLGVVTLLVAWFSDALVGSIDDFCEETGVSRSFVGLIVLPIVGNAVEHITAVNVAMKNKMDLSLGVAIGSCTQIALFVVPVTVIVGWCVNKPMTLNFPHFEVILYVLSILTVAISLGTGRSNWLLGSLLCTAYAMVAVGFWFEKVESY